MTLNSLNFYHDYMINNRWYMTIVQSKYLIRLNNDTKVKVKCKVFYDHELSSEESITTVCGINYYQLLAVMQLK